VDRRTDGQSLQSVSQLSISELKAFFFFFLKHSQLKASLFSCLGKEKTEKKFKRKKKKEKTFFLH